jgi:hypothetical protein
MREKRAVLRVLLYVHLDALSTCCLAGGEIGAQRAGPRI